jgi:AcrR family transcriptional regulator
VTVTPVSNPGSGSRADAQRDRILTAALNCFVEHGFHAASIAGIADAAQMSQGLIYRYFENKDAIVLGIVERQLEEKRALLRELHTVEQLSAELLRVFESWCVRESTVMSVALFLEMSAEATRNPRISAALQASDELTRDGFRNWIARDRVAGGLGFAPDEADRRALQMRLVVDGLAVRAAREPGIDRAQLKDALDWLIERLLVHDD